MKAVLISIQPKWCELIASGKKTVEVRKTRPKIETPFECYIYCTSSNVHECLMLNRSGATLIHSINYKKAIPCGGHIGNGKVIGEFVCDKVTEFYPTIDLKQLTSTHFQMCEKSCVNMRDLYNYANGKILYGWHISDLVIYDKPKELSSFSVLDDKAVKECRHRERIYVNPNSVNGAWLKGSYICTKEEEDWCSKCKTKPITRPPQSWCYVEKNDLKESNRMTNDKQRERLVELLQEASIEAGKHFRETTKKVLAEKGCFNSATDIDRRNIYEVEADYLLANGLIVPPCKVGDKVYFVFEGDVLSDEITLIEVTESAMYLSTCSERYMLINGYLYSEMLDEKAYFTKEEAEEALGGGAK